MEDWRYNVTYSGVPQGGVVSPILSNLVLDRLDKFVEQTLMPAYTCGDRRKTYPPYVALTKAAWQARRSGDMASAKMYSQQAQMIPSRDPYDPNFRRLRFCRYADDFLLSFIGSKAEAQAIKEQLSTFLRDELKLELSDEKTIITHAQEGMAHFLGYDIHVLHADDKHDKRGQRCINGSIGLRVPLHVIHEHCRKYMRNGKPSYLPQRLNDDAYSIVSRYQGEYRGVVQYYKLAYNLHRLSQLKGVMESSLTKTLAQKFKSTQRKIYARFRKAITNEYGTYKVLEVVLDRGPEKKPLVTHWGGIPLRRNKWAAISETLHQPIWSHRTELVDRLRAQQCELCGSTENVEVHHIRKLKDLDKFGQSDKPEWAYQMSARRRKTLIVCQKCHNDIHYGRYDGPALSTSGTGKPRETESAHAWFGGEALEKRCYARSSLAPYPTARTVLRGLGGSNALWLPGAYLLAERLHLSGVIAVAMAGLAVGNFGLQQTASSARESIVLFWEILAFLVNSIVFLLIGFELRPDRLVDDLLAAAVIFVVLLAARALIVYGLTALIHWRQRSLPWSWRHTIFWGGLRGAVPVALALGLPAGLPGRNDLAPIIFGVVLFSLLGQGLTMSMLLRRLGLAQSEPAP